LHCNGHD
jgi:ATP-dependent Zn protease